MDPVFYVLVFDLCFLVVEFGIYSGPIILFLVCLCFAYVYKQNRSLTEEEFRTLHIHLVPDRLLNPLDSRKENET